MPSNSMNDFIQLYVDDEIKLNERVREDFITQLSKVKQVEIVKTPTKKGINIISEKSDKKIEIQDSQSFYIESNALLTTIIVDSNPDSVQRAIYYLLNNLGFDFLWYSDNWINIPEEYEPYITDKKLVSPKVPSLYFSGTGGLRPYLTQLNMDRLYKQRNHWHLGDYSPVGHSLKSFYKKKKSKIDSYHKNGIKIFNDYQGKKKDLNLDRPETLDLLKEFFYDQLKKDGSINQISVSPFDGIGKKEKLPESIKEIDNVGEKQWWWIKEVAKSIEKTHPEVTVKVNAYGDGPFHAAVPDFEMPSNILVQIAPDAFQKAYPDRNSMYNAWYNKGQEDGFDKFFYRGYLNITQWSKGGLPKTNLNRNVFKLVSDLEMMELEGLRLETTHFVIMAPLLYVFSKQLNYESEKSEEELYHEFFTKAFPKSEEYVKSMFNRWFVEGFNGESELGNAINDLEQAYQIKDLTDLEKNRIEELMIYIHYLSLYYQSQKENTEEAALELEKYALKANHLGVLQTRAIIYYDYGRVKSYGHGKSPYKKVKEDKFGYLSKTEILQNFQTDKSKYSKKIDKIDLDIDINNLQTDTKLRTYKVKPSSKNQRLKVISKGGNELSIELQGVSTGLRVKVTKDEKVIYSDLFTKEHKEKKLTYRLNEPGEYQISFNKKLSSYTVKTTDVILNNSVSIKSSSKTSNFYFYVPKNIDEIVIKALLKENTFIYYPNVDGTFIKVKPEKLYKDTYKIKTTTKTGREIYDARGKVWKLQHRNNDWDILNFPKVSSPFPFDYIE